MKEQIEEMAREMCHLSAECETCQICDERYHGDGEPCYFQCVAKEIINHGYRKQKEGEWIDRYNGDFVNPIYLCSVCEKGPLLKPYIDELGNMQMVQALSPFCPNCGAKMKGGAE